MNFGCGVRRNIASPTRGGSRLLSRFNRARSSMGVLLRLAILHSESPGWTIKGYVPLTLGWFSEPWLRTRKDWAICKRSVLRWLMDLSRWLVTLLANASSPMVLPDWTMTSRHATRLSSGTDSKRRDAFASAFSLSGNDSGRIRR